MRILVKLTTPFYFAFCFHNTIGNWRGEGSNKFYCDTSKILLTPPSSHLLRRWILNGPQIKGILKFTVFCLQHASPIPSNIPTFSSTKSVYDRLSDRDQDFILRISYEFFSIDNHTTAGTTSPMCWSKIKLPKHWPCSLVRLVLQEKSNLYKCQVKTSRIYFYAYPAPSMLMIWLYLELPRT